MEERETETGISSVSNANNLYMRMRELAYDLQEDTKKLIFQWCQQIDNQVDLRDMSSFLKKQEQQDKNYNSDLELENFYLAIKLLLYREFKPYLNE